MRHFIASLMKQGMLVLSFLMVASTIQAQYFDFFQQEYFFGWAPNVRAESMAQADVAVGGTISSLFNNPAGIGLIERAEFDFSTSGPFYLLRKSDYYFVGGAWRFHPKFVGAISFNAIAIGPTSFGININGTTFPTDRPISSNLTLSVAGEPIKNLNIGINTNIFRWKYISEVSATYALMLDLGALYTIPLDGSETNPERGVRFGASVSNLNHSAISFSSGTGEESSNNLPAIGRYALSYFNRKLIKLPGAKQGGLDLLTTLEIQDVLNSAFRTSIRFGNEFVAYDVFAFRLGYYRTSQNDMGASNNKSRIATLTYGFGLILPVDQFSKGKWPVKVHFDFMSQNQPSLTFTGTEVANVRGFAFRVVWNPESIN